MNKKREAEMSKLKRDLEEQQMNYESQLLTMKKKNQDAINELSDQIDILTKTKSKYVNVVPTCQGSQHGYLTHIDNTYLLLFL